MLEQPACLLGVRPARILAEVTREALLRSRELADLEEDPPELEPSRRILPRPIESLLDTSEYETISEEEFEDEYDDEDDWDDDLDEDDDDEEDD